MRPRHSTSPRRRTSVPLLAPSSSGTTTRSRVSDKPPWRSIKRSTPPSKPNLSARSGKLRPRSRPTHRPRKSQRTPRWLTPRAKSQTASKKLLRCGSKCCESGVWEQMETKAFETAWFGKGLARAMFGCLAAKARVSSILPRFFTVTSMTDDHGNAIDAYDRLAIDEDMMCNALDCRQDVFFSSSPVLLVCSLPSPSALSPSSSSLTYTQPQHHRTRANEKM